MNFIETRGNDGKNALEVTFSQAILNPSASFGGLYVPKELPHLGLDFVQTHLTSSYKALAFDLLKRFEIDIEDQAIQTAVDLYDAFDNPNDPCPVVKLKEDLFVQEQYHGPTRAFKDMALQPFGSILAYLAKKQKENYLILAATSGDTGPAALNTFKNKEGIKVACLYPSGGTSDVQRLQMVCEDGKNLKVIGIHGNFDDAQAALKNLLSSVTFKEELNKHGIKLSAANSVNFGRIIFQIVYHIHSYIELLKQGEITLGEKIYLIVPSGNFGNALGGYYAQKMGIPIEKILIASNENNILTQWINDGVYDIRGKELILTKSPAMDILKSSNIERVLFDLFGAVRTKELMDDLNEKQIFTLTQDEKSKIQSIFSAVYSNDAYGLDKIKEYMNNNYLMDPHTATCLKAYETLKTKPLKAVMYSTAEWTKFSPTVLNAIKQNQERYHDKEALQEIAQICDTKITKSVQDLFGSTVIHKNVINKENIEKEIINFIQN